jgi:hypothetical protein
MSVFLFCFSNIILVRDIVNKDSNVFDKIVKNYVKYCINYYFVIRLKREINHIQTYTPLFEREHFSHPLCVI